MWKSQFIELLREGKVTEAIALKENHIPKSLYKFQSYHDKSIENFENDLVHLKNPKQFNDPYDSSFSISLQRLGVKLDKPVLELNRGKFEDGFLNILDNLLKQREEKIMQEMAAGWKEKTLKVSCFTERLDSLLMWAHYADMHKGFCLEYNFFDLTNTDTRKRLIFPVLYSNHLPDITDLFFHANPVINLSWGLLPALIKSKDWQYENEWRLIYAYNLGETISTVAMPKPSSVYLGKRMPQEAKEIINGIAHRKEIEVKQMELDAYNFGMTAKPGNL